MPPIPADPPQLFVPDGPAAEPVPAPPAREPGSRRRLGRGSRRPVPVLLAVDGNGLAHRA